MEHARRYAQWYFFTVLFLATFLVWYAVFAEERKDILTVAFLDVGQGDAIFIEAPNGNQVLIDGGPNKKVLRELSKLMPFYDRSIDIVIATHPDADHIGGLVDVVERFDIDIFLEPGVQSDTKTYEELLRLVEAERSRYVVARRGMSIALDDGVYLKILFPDRDVSDVDTNDASIIVQLVYGKTEFLLTGDAPKKIEEYVVFLDGENLRSDVLKLGHHGSKTSSSELFIGFVSPSRAIISAGKNNRYGHPHDEVLDTLEQFEIDTLSTYEEGTIVFRSDGESLILK